MGPIKQPGIRYATRYCALRKQEVRVILTQQSNGSWGFAKCLDKGKECAGRLVCPVETSRDRRRFEDVWIG